MTPTRAGIAFVACWLTVHPAWAQTPAPKGKPTGELVRALTSDQHQTRDRAVVELVQCGAAAVSPLLTASVAKDPELAWRAGEALQVLGQTADKSIESAIKQELVKASHAANAPEAAVAKKILAQWPILRHHYAAAQLELLGAEIADNPLAPTTESVPAPGGFIPAGGVFFAGIMPALADDGDEMIVEEPVAADEVEIVEEERLVEVGDPAPPVARAAGFGAWIKVIGRAAGKAIRDDDAAGEALGEAVAEVILKGVAKPLAEKRDVEFLEEPPAEPIDVDGIDLVRDVEFLEERVIDAGIDAVHTVPLGVEEPAAETDQLQPGTLRIGKEWRGGDAGLEYVAQLQQIHTVILRDAPLTDAALTQLRKLASLSQLRVHRTRLSSAALMKFRQQRPEVTITAVGAAMLGVAGSDHPNGLLVQQVTPETGARRAGLDEQDIITKIDGLKVASFNDVTLALYDKVPGGKVKVEYLRGGKRQTVDVVLSERDSSTTAAGLNTGAAVQTWHSHKMLRGFGGGMAFPIRLAE